MIGRPWEVNIKNLLNNQSSSFLDEFSFFPGIGYLKVKKSPLGGP